MIKKWLEKRKLRNDWQLVKVIHDQRSWSWTSGPNKGKQTGEITDIYYRLFENALRERKCSINVTGYKGNERCRVKPKEYSIYQQGVYPWLMGIEDKDIPTYQDIKDKNLLENAQR